MKEQDKLEPNVEIDMRPPSVGWWWRPTIILPLIPMATGLVLLIVSRMTEDPVLSQAREIPGLILTATGGLSLLTYRR